MPSILSEDDKETVRRNVPKAANKIHAVAVARLYVAYPNRQRWTYTGLQGAAVLANDLVGNTFWLKLVDISPSNRGVIWDQEIYEGFSYNQDRTFFHSFEIEECLAGFSFVDEKEARQFKKKVEEREKNASKATKATPFRRSGEPTHNGHATGSRKHSLLGGFTNFLHPGRASSPSNHQPPAEPPRVEKLTDGQLDGPHPSNGPNGSALDEVDPSWKGILEQLLAQGITEDQIEENQDFIKAYIEQNQGANGNNDGSSGIANRDRPPPPPPPSAPPGMRAKSISPQNTGGTVGSRRGPPPAPPPSRRSRVESYSAPSPPLPSNTPSPPSRSPAREPSPPRGPPAPRFRAPPPIADAGKYAHSDPPPQPPRQPVPSNAGPPPPPRPPKTPMDEPAPARPRFAVPPPLHAERAQASVPPPPPPSRSHGPVSSGRDSPQPPPSISIAPPPLPPKATNGPPPVAAAPPPPLLPNVGINRSQAPAPAPAPQPEGFVPPPPAPPLPPPLPSTARPVPVPPPPPSATGPPLPPPAPPLPSVARPSAPPGPSMDAAPPPPPPPPPPGAPLAARPPTDRDSGYQSATPSAPPLPKPSGGVEDVMASIRASGGMAGGRLKKVDDSQKRDRSAAMIPGSENSAGGTSRASPAPAAAGGEVGLAGALAAALSKRKAKVSQSDDEDDDEDWDETPKARK